MLSQHPLVLSTLLITLFISACGSGNNTNDTNNSEAITETYRIDFCDTNIYTGDSSDDGEHCILVTQEDGSQDHIWLSALAPTGMGPFPVVIYAKGQGLSTLMNCSPNAPPNVKQDIANLVNEGYLVIAISYRNAGPNADTENRFYYRDHALYDARAILAAAQWAIQHHGKATNQIALLGESMGTWPAFWASTKHPSLSDVQTGLNLQSLILTGESANHLANIATVLGGPILDIWQQSDTLSQFKLAVAMAITSMSYRAFNNQQFSLTLNDITSGSELHNDLQEDLQAIAIDLLPPIVFNGADTTLPQCANLSGLSPLCNEQCLAATGLDFFNQRNLDPSTILANPDNWLKSPLKQALTWWPRSNSLPVDPWSTLSPPDSLRLTNPVIKGLVDGSPVYSATDSLISQRAQHLLSTHDSHFDIAARYLLSSNDGQLARLGATNISVPFIETDGGQMCEHKDYLNAQKPNCGLYEILNELNTAFSP